MPRGAANGLRAGLALAGVAGMPGEMGIVGSYGIDKAAGNPHAERNLAKSGVRYGAKELLAEPVARAAGVGGLMGLGTAVDIGVEAFSANPDFERAGVGSVAGTIGGMIGSTFGPIGAIAGGTLAKAAMLESMDHGMYGDARDRRSWEQVRDFYEERGWDRGETKDLALGISDGVRSDIKQFNHMEKMKSLGDSISNNYTSIDGIANNTSYRTNRDSGGEGGFGGSSGGGFGDRESSPGGMGGV